MLLSSIISSYHKWPKCASAFFMLLSFFFFFFRDLSLGSPSLHCIRENWTENFCGGFVDAEWSKRGSLVSCKLYSCLYISAQCLSFSQQPDVVDFMFSLNRLFPPYPFVKSCYLTCFSSSCIYVNDYSFLCFTCTYWIPRCFSQNFTHFCVIGGFFDAFSVPRSFFSSASFTFLIQTFTEPKKYSCTTPFNA